MRKPRGRVSDGRVFEISDIKADTRHLHPDYKYVVADGSLAENDRLLIFELCPKIAGLPSFAARWDGGNRSGKVQYALDIDIRGVSDEEIKQFKRGKNGYCGHHAKQVGNENKYHVRLKTPVALIFDATITFSRQHNLLASSSAIGSEVTVTQEKRRPSILKRLANGIMYLYQLARSSVRLRG
jgi:hypothetical protein